MLNLYSTYSIMITSLAVLHAKFVATVCPNGLSNVLVKWNRMISVHSLPYKTLGHASVAPNNARNVSPDDLYPALKRTRKEWKIIEFLCFVDGKLNIFENVILSINRSNSAWHAWVE